MADRFQSQRVKWFYCGKQIEWTWIIERYKQGVPDWILNDGFEGFVSLEKLKSIQQMPISIDSMFQELQEYYRLYHMWKIERNFKNFPDRFQIDYESLKEIPRAQMIVERDQELIFRVSIPLLLKIEPKEIVEFPALENYPWISFSITRDSLIDPKYTYTSPSPFWETLLSSIKLSSGQQTMAADCVSQANQLASDAFKSWKLRKQFIKGMIESFGTSLEYDGVLFQKITWLIESSPLLILTCNLPSDFPLKPYTAQLQAISRSSSKQTVFSTQPIPYSPRWTIEEHISRFQNWVLAEAEGTKKFQTENF